MRQRAVNFPESPKCVAAGGWVCYLGLCPKLFFFGHLPLPLLHDHDPYQGQMLNLQGFTIHGVLMVVLA